MELEAEPWAEPGHVTTCWLTESQHSDFQTPRFKGLVCKSDQSKVFAVDTVKRVFANSCPQRSQHKTTSAYYVWPSHGSPHKFKVNNPSLRPTHRAAGGQQHSPCSSYLYRKWGSRIQQTARHKLRQRPWRGQRASCVGSGGGGQPKVRAKLRGGW